MKKLIFVLLMATGVWRAGAAPVITAGPTNSVVAIGQAAGLGVTVTGTGLGYQWFKDGVWLVGQTNSNLSFGSFQFTNSGAYRVVVTNATGIAISRPAFLSVTNAPLLAWGENEYGQVGNGTYSNSVSTPVSVASNAVAVAAG